jgi:cytochrome P450
MGYCERIDATPEAGRWHLVKQLMAEEPFPFFAEMRERRPVLALPNVTLVYRFADCSLVMRRHDDFGVDLYKPKQGDYFMAQDDTADHWRDKSIMRAILDFERIPAIRRFVADTAQRLLAEGRGWIDLPQAVTRMVPVEVVREFFGFASAEAKDLIDWSYWNQIDAFHNQAFDEQPDAANIVTERENAIRKVGLSIAVVVAKRAIPARLGLGGDDPVTRLLKLSFSGALKFPIPKVILNVGGLLIGTVETTSFTACNALAELFARPEVFAEACRVAREDAPEAMDAYVYEALRFRPAFPWFFRTCHTRTELAGGTPHATWVEPGTTVLAMTHSAMHDPAAFPDPTTFDPRRSQADNFVLGYGLHECLGRPIAKPMLGEILRQILRLPGLEQAGPVLSERGVPEHFPIRWAV